MDAELADMISSEVILETRYIVDLLERAWGIIANAGRDITNEGNGWENESEEWQEAAIRWRDDFHSLLKEIINA